MGHRRSSRGAVAVQNFTPVDAAKGPGDPELREQAMRKYFKVSETALVAAVKKYAGPS